MTRKSILALSLVAATAIGGALTVPALAHSTDGDDWGRGGGDGGLGMMGGQASPGMAGGADMQGMMGMMQKMHGRMMDGIGMMGGMGGPGMMGGALFESFDADEDGTVTPDELRAGLEGQLKTYDADGNGTLSIAEFEDLHSKATRERTVRRFQMFDRDGDGQVTLSEITAPAKHMERMQKLRAAAQDPGATNAPGQGRGMGSGIGNQQGRDMMGAGSGSTTTSN